LTVRGGVNNILDARSRSERDVYAAFRDANPLAFLERRNRLIGTRQLLGPVRRISIRQRNMS